MSKTPAQLASDVNDLSTSQLHQFNNVCSATDIFEIQTGASQAIQDLAAEVDGLSESDLSAFAAELNSISGNGKGSRRPC